jgi:hypothetical protein
MALTSLGPLVETWHRAALATTATATALPPGCLGLAPTLMLGRNGAEQHRLHVPVLG